MSILITGGSGFIGTELAKKLIEKKYKVILFDITPPKKEMKGVLFTKGNISNWPEVCNVIKDNKVKHIFHLAAMLSAQCEANPWAAYQTNVLGIYNVLEASRLFNIKKVIFTSSMGVYGKVSKGIAYDETIQRPQILYGITKVFGELLGLYYHNRFGVDFRGVRFPQLVGLGIKSEGYGQYIPRMIESALKAIPFKAWVTKKTSIPIMYIKDAVRCLIELFDARETSVRTRIYNVGQITPSPTAGEILKEISNYSSKLLISFKPDPKAMKVLKTIPVQLDDQNARKEWGWRIRYGLKEMIEDFIKEFSKQDL